jgi:hypothetical protein
MVATAGLAGARCAAKPVSIRVRRRALLRLHRAAASATAGARARRPTPASAAAAALAPATTAAAAAVAAPVRSRARSFPALPLPRRPAMAVASATPRYTPARRAALSRGLKTSGGRSRLWSLRTCCLRSSLRRPAPVLAAVAKMLPWVACAGFGVYCMRFNLALGLAAALRSADVFVVAALGGVGWAFGRYLESVSKRFDATDAALREVKELLRARALSARGVARRTRLWRASHCGRSVNARRKR